MDALSVRNCAKSGGGRAESSDQIDGGEGVLFSPMGLV